MTEPTPSRDLTRTFLAVICLAALVFTSLWILQPFLAPLIWATLLVIASWPTLRRFESWLGNKRSLAVIAMMGVLLLVFVIPFLMVLRVLVERTPDVVAWIHKLLRESCARVAASGQADILLIEPEPTDGILFMHNPASFAARRKILEYAYRTTRARLAELFKKGEPALERAGWRLRAGAESTAPRDEGGV